METHFSAAHGNRFMNIVTDRSDLSISLGFFLDSVFLRVFLGLLKFGLPLYQIVCVFFVLCDPNHLVFLCRGPFRQTMND